MFKIFGNGFNKIEDEDYGNVGRPMVPSTVSLTICLRTHDMGFAGNKYPINGYGGYVTISTV